MPCGIWLLVSKPNQLTPVNRTTLPAESTIFDPFVDQNASPGAAAAYCAAASKIAAASQHGLAVHIRRRIMISLRQVGWLCRSLCGHPECAPGVSDPGSP